MKGDFDYTSFLIRQRHKQWLKDKICANCGNKKVTLHHKVLKSQGGLEIPSNWEALCRKCHDKEHSIIQKYKHPNKKFNGHK